jgi:hypothetical protein
MFSSVLISLALGSAACGHPRSPAELEAGLNDPDPKVRRTSADGLRHGDDVPADAVPKLLAAIANEKDPEVYGAELITLGASGVADAKPLICKNIGGGGDVRMSRWANHAWQAFERKNPGAKCDSTAPAAAAPSAAPTSDQRSM